MKKYVSRFITKIIEPQNTIPLQQQRFSNSQLMSLIIPIVIEQLLSLLVGIVDTMMISYVGEAAVSGVSLVNQLNTVFITVFSALGSGGAIVASQYVGRDDRKSGSLAASQLVMITLVIATGIAALLLGFGSGLFDLVFGSVETDVRQSALTYLRISAYSFPFLAVYNGCAGLYRSMGKTRTLMIVSIIMNVINVVGNAIGVFMLKAGVEGVAYPSLISRAFAAVVMFYLACGAENMIRVRVRDVFRWSGEMIRRIFHVAVPNAVENGLFQLSKVGISAIVAMFGTVQIAANGIAQSFWSMAGMFTLAMGVAFITVIGQHMGAGEIEGAEYYMKKLLRLTYVGSAVWILVFSALSPALLELYSMSEETKHLTLILMVIHNSFNLLLCPVAFSLSHGLQAAGDVKYTMYSAIFGTVVIRVILSVLFGIIFDMGVIGVALAMACDWAVKALLIWIRYRSGKWKTKRVL